MTGMDKWPDYDRQGLEICEDKLYEVYDPWSAQIVGMFYQREHAELFAKAYVKKSKKANGQ